MMYWLPMSLTLCSLVVSQTTDNGNPKCDQSDRSLFYLEAASDMITKAKLYYPARVIKKYQDWYPSLKVKKHAECRRLADINLEPYQAYVKSYKVVAPGTSVESRFENCRINTQNKTSIPIDCTDVLNNGHNQSGVYTIWPKSRLTDDKPLDVFCDMDTDGGGWTVLQRRGNFNRSNDYFFQDWASYKIGFGDIRKDFWIGNDNMFALTNQRPYSIRIDLQDVEGEKRYAVYDTFWIDDENNKYTLHIKDYSGDAGDSMTPKHDNQKFTTKDQDNDISKDKNCAQEYKGAWWYYSCHTSNLNGLYLRGKYEIRGTGVNWYSWKGSNESLKTTEMKIRPKNFWKNLILLDTPASF